MRLTRSRRFAIAWQKRRYFAATGRSRPWPPAALAVAAAFVQPLLVSEPMSKPEDYLLLWGMVAAVALAAAVVGMWLLDRARPSERMQPTPRTGLAPLVPCLVAGALVTFVLLRLSPETAWLLPGLWQLFFSQGLFACCRTLPRPLFAVPSFYLIAGLCSLGFARNDYALSPWAMGLPFGVGQILAAFCLYWTLERHERIEETATTR